MVPSNSVDAFETFVEGVGGSLPELTVRQGVARMLEFFELVPVEACVDDQGDMLLFQWGTYDWGDGKHFSINITRQFIESKMEGDDAISQLQLTFKFPPTKESATLGSASRWCKGKADIEDFRRFVFSSKAFAFEADTDPPNVSVHHEYV